ncbi:MAG: ABC transporter substrate-binding protein, partial [Advenella sp.]
MTSKDTAVQSGSTTLRIGIEQGILTFDPHNNGSFGTPLMNIFDTLVRMNPEGKFLPNLVREFSRKDDLTWSFSLRPNITFHNGDALTSKDVKFSLERVASDKSLIENPRFNTIDSVKVINDTDFEIVTKIADPVLLNRLIRMGGSILPQKYFTEHGTGYFNLHPVGSGPYRVMSYEMDRKLVLKKFSAYFKGNVADWDDAIFSVLPGEATRVNELVTGGMDVITEVPPAEWPRVNNHAGTKVIDAASTQVLLLMVNANEAFPTSDKRVRQAIEYAIDSRLIVDKLFGGLGTPTRTPITPGILGFDKDLYDKSSYDLKKSVALLQEAGYSRDKPLKLKLQIPKGRYLMDSELGQLIAAMLAQAGIQVQMELLENSKYVQVRNNNKNEALMLAGYG